MNIEDLKKPFDPSLISWRVGATNKDKTKGIALAYIDARDVMERFDEVCGLGNWQNKYSHANQKTICDIGIRIDNEWIWKSNGAGDTQVEAEKGAISDAFKRSAVMWGVGRYLYDVQNIWVELKQVGRSYVIANPNDSRLIGALEKAAAGIRVIEEPKEPVRMFEAHDIQVLEDGIEECQSIEELKAKWTTIHSYHKAGRLQQHDYESLEKVKDRKKGEM